MYSEEEAKTLVEKECPGVKAQDCFGYKDIWLVRVEFPIDEESNYDPFFSVDPKTGKVNEFSVLTDGDPIEIGLAFEQRNPPS